VPAGEDSVLVYRTKTLDPLKDKYLLTFAQFVVAVGAAAPFSVSAIAISRLQGMIRERVRFQVKRTAEYSETRVR